MIVTTLNWFRLLGLMLSPGARQMGLRLNEACRIMSDQTSNAGAPTFGCSRIFEAPKERPPHSSSSKIANLLPYNQQGAMAVAGVWLTFYLIAAVHYFISSGN